MTEHDKRHPLEPTTSMLRVLKSRIRAEDDDDSELDSNSIRDVLDRVGQIADSDDVVLSPDPRRPVAASQPFANGPAAPHHEHSRTPEPDDSETTRRESRKPPESGARSHPRDAAVTSREDVPYRHAEKSDVRYWWLSFNGSVSLQRLGRVRQRLLESPFTLESRYDEIGDGIVAMRVVTESSLTTQQLEWIIGQLLETEGLDRNAAIVSAD